MWKKYLNVASVDEAVKVLADEGERARIVAGATDLILEIERGVRKGIDTLIDITRIPDLDRIVMDEEDVIHLGPLVTHNHCVDSKLIVERAYPLARACWEVGAPQIRNRGTVAGNLITASPANDAISPLIALNAQVTLLSQRGKRVVPLAEFYTGVRRTLMQPDELLLDIAFPAMTCNQRGVFLKLGLRRAQAISLVNATVILTFVKNGNDKGSRMQLSKKVKHAAITLGAVAPTIIHASQAEQYLTGRDLDEQTIEQAARLAEEAARPIGDVRSSAEYRHEMVRVCVARSLRAIALGEERLGFPEHPVLLWGAGQGDVRPITRSVEHGTQDTIVTRINGKEYAVSGGAGKTLLRFLREDVGLIGTKEGCAEGECGACTVHLDGMAVMSCLVPAPRAHNAEIVTIEGLEKNGQLHPVQEAFIDAGAVQCGYCTPGFVMSAAKLLEERPQPSRDEIAQAITGNLCRCTGYYKIIAAIEQAAQREAVHG